MSTTHDDAGVEFPALKEARGKLDAKRKALFDVLTEAGPDYDMSKVKSLSGDSHAKVAELGKMNAEIDEAATKVEELTVIQKSAVKAVEHKNGHTEPGTQERSEDTEQGSIEPGTKSVQHKTFGELVTQSPTMKGFTRGSNAGPTTHLDVELKTLFQTTAGWLPETTRTGRVVDFATRPIQVIDVIPGNTTSQSAIVYMEETTFTNAAAETAEGGTWPESALALTEVSSPVRKIATYIPVTDEQLEDEVQVRGYLNNRLPFMLRQRLDSQILNGNGTAPNLRGFINVVGIQTQAKGADPIPDAIYKAMVKVRVTGRAVPSATIIHPTDFQSIRLLRTADGIYIWGNPTDAGPMRIWGLPIVESDAIALGTALTGDFANYTELATRRGVDVQISSSHSTFFVEGKQCVRADVRVALVVYRPTALCTVTGL